jgi:hypothetical protein
MKGEIMNIGRLYTFAKYYWFLFPSKDISASLRTQPVDIRPAAVSAADYFSTCFNCNIYFIEPSSLFVLLEQEENCCRILTTEGMVGWIWLDERYNESFEEVKP